VPTDERGESEKNILREEKSGAEGNETRPDGGKGIGCIVFDSRDEKGRKRGLSSLGRV